MKNYLHALPLTAALICFSNTTAASLEITFVESAPKDWFSVSNLGECTLQELTLNIDLSKTAGQLIFDTTATGAGVEVFQPFEVREGDIKLTSAAKVNDGEKTLSVLVKDLQPNASASFTIDVDDTLPKSELGNIRVSGAEISGGKVSITVGDTPAIEGTFDKNGKTSLPSPTCA